MPAISRLSLIEKSLSQNRHTTYYIISLYTNNKRYVTWVSVTSREVAWRHERYSVTSREVVWRHERYSVASRGSVFKLTWLSRACCSAVAMALSYLGKRCVLINRGGKSILGGAGVQYNLQMLISYYFFKLISKKKYQKVCLSLI